MRTILELADGRQFEIAPLNFEQYAKQYEPINSVMGLVPRSAYDHWKDSNRYREISDFTLPELTGGKITYCLSAEELDIGDIADDCEDVALEILKRRRTVTQLKHTISLDEMEQRFAGEEENSDG